MTNKLKVINLFGGPGSGKSTTRADLFSIMKKNKYIVEETTEYAKDATYDKNLSVLSDQLYILAKQNRKLERLRGKVEWVVTDAPILLSYNYATVDYLPKSFKNLAFELWETYDNYNFLMNRAKPYFEFGRSQSLEEAIEIDKRIVDMLTFNFIGYDTVAGDEYAATVIESIIRPL